MHKGFKTVDNKLEMINQSLNEQFEVSIKHFNEIHICKLKFQVKLRSDN